ncbi:MAG: hypothetical protein IKK11_08740 [Oscillospiraceae bacterium]|nr:hypothetical protein [Oscillospiraceae bacterium]
MEQHFSQKFTISYLHTDRFGRATPTALLYFMQEASGSHCALLEVDREHISPKHLFWAVTRSKVQVTRLPRLHETITVETWPMPTTRVAYPRSVVAYDPEGNELFRSVSLWVLMDDRTRTLVLPGKSGVTVNGQLNGTELAVPHGIAALPAEGISQRTVGYSCLDQNGHMNNTRYMDWVCDLLPSEFHRQHQLKDLTVCYLNEALENDTVDLQYSLSDGPTLTVDAQRAGQRIFSTQAVFEQIL